jgi:hypothetical protein
MNGREETGRTLEFDHLLFLRYRNQLRPELDSELCPTTIHQKREHDTSQDMGTFRADRWVRISQEALVGEAYKQRRLAHRRIAYKTIAPSVSFFETTKMHRLSRLASDDELENIMPCYTSHGVVVRSDGNCREKTRAQLLRFAYRSAHSRSRSPRSLRVECRLDAPRWSDGGHDCAKPFGEVSRHCRCSFHSTKAKLYFTVTRLLILIPPFDLIVA